LSGGWHDFTLPLTPVLADITGVVQSIYADGELVEYGQTVASIRPE